MKIAPVGAETTPPPRRRRLARRARAITNRRQYWRARLAEAEARLLELDREARDLARDVAEALA